MKINLKKGERPNINLCVYRVEADVWWILDFYKHHYLTNELNVSSKCLLFTWEKNPVAFVAILNTPRKGLPHDMSVSRLVVLPEYQGLGVSSFILNFCGGIVCSMGSDYRLLIKTIHEKVGKFLGDSHDWRPTTHNQKYRKDLEGKKFENNLGLARSSFCYVYCGEKIKGYEDLLQPIKNIREKHYGIQELDFGDFV